jgi:hypothetical protein
MSALAATAAAMVAATAAETAVAMVAATVAETAAETAAAVQEAPVVAVQVLEVPVLAPAVLEAAVQVLAVVEPEVVALEVVALEVAVLVPEAAAQALAVVAPEVAALELAVLVPEAAAQAPEVAPEVAALEVAVLVPEAAGGLVALPVRGRPAASAAQMEPLRPAWAVAQREPVSVEAAVETAPLASARRVRSVHRTLPVLPARALPQAVAPLAGRRRMGRPRGQSVRRQDPGAGRGATSWRPLPVRKCAAPTSCVPCTSGAMPSRAQPIA